MAPKFTREFAPQTLEGTNWKPNAALAAAADLTKPRREGGGAIGGGWAIRGPGKGGKVSLHGSSRLPQDRIDVDHAFMA